MPHLKINAYFGRDPLKSHQPTSCLRLPTGQLLTIGEVGECVMWESPSAPQLVMVASINQSAGCVFCCAVVNTSNLTNEVLAELCQTTMKLLTIGEGNRLRLWKLDDGICVNITGFDCFEEKIVGCASELKETRFVYLHSDYSIYVFDCWKMAVMLRIKTDARIVRLYRETVGDKELLVVRDSLKKLYAWNVTELQREKWMDFRNIIGSSTKTEEELKAAENKQKDEPLTNANEIECHEILVEDERALSDIKQFLKDNEGRQDVRELFHPEYLRRYDILRVMDPSEEITRSCMVFLNHSTPYFFLGCRSGRLYGLPVFHDLRKCRTVLMTEFDSDGNGSEVKFLTTRKNTMFVSYRSGLFRVYSLEMMELAIVSELKSKKEQTTEVVSIPLKRFLNLETRLGSPAKYQLETYRIPSPYASEQGSAPPADAFTSFQLANKEVVMVGTRDKQLYCLKGTFPSEKLYCVLLFDLYVGVAASAGINIYRLEGCSYERTIRYQNWEWRDYSLHRRTEIDSYYNSYRSFRSGSENSYLVNFSNRYLTHTVNYFDPKYGIVYETFGALDEAALDNEHYPEFYFGSRAYCESIIHSRNLTSVMSVLKVRNSRERQESWGNTAYVLHTDVKRQVEKLFAEPADAEEQVAAGDSLNSFSLIFPEDIEEGLAKSLQPFIGYTRPALRHLMCFQGIGMSLTLYLVPAMNLRMSSFLTSYNALSMMLYFITICSRNSAITDLMLECVKYFTLKKPAANKPLSLTHLAQLSIEGNNNVVNAGCNLMMSAMLGREIDLSRFEEYFILNLKFLEETKSRLLSSIEVYWMLVMGFAYIYAVGAAPQKIEMLVNRLVAAIEYVCCQLSPQNFERVPELMAISLKIFNEGIEKWRALIDPARAYTILNSLFSMFFFYDGLAPQLSVGLDTSDPLLNKRMKQIIVKTVVNIANHYTNQFLQLLKKESVNQELHPMYPCSVVEILRQYLKTQKPQRHLVFYIELLLKCISPTTPQLRKHVQKNVTQTLYYLCNYRNISFNQPSQKIALLSVNHLYIYDLRTATKWRTIDIEGGEGVEHIVCMSPKGNYIAVLGRNLKIWRLSSSFWSGMLGAFSQGWTFEATGKAIKWEESEASLTVEAINPNQNKVFVL